MAARCPAGPEPMTKRSYVSIDDERINRQGAKTKNVRGYLASNRPVAAIIRSMGERDESALGRADGFFKRVLERVGATVDEKLRANDASRLPANAVGAMAAAIERAIEEHVRADARGVRRVAPDRFAVLLTYE